MHGGDWWFFYFNNITGLALSFVDSNIVVPKECFSEFNNFIFGDFSKCIKITYFSTPTGTLRLDKISDQALSACCVVIQDRKSTRLNSSHVKISYAVFCLQKK